MTKNIYLSAFFALFLLLGLQLQAQTDYAGDWNGAIELPGIKLEIALQLKYDKPNWTGALDIPMQHAKGLKLADLQIAGKKIQFKLPDVPGNASFAGEFNDSGQKMEGTFSQSGQSFPMKLTRADALEERARGDRLLMAGGVKGLGGGLVGAPATIAARIDRYAQIGVDCLMLRFLPAFEGMDRFARDVMPLLRVQGALAPA